MVPFAFENVNVWAHLRCRLPYDLKSMFIVFFWFTIGGGVYLSLAPLLIAVTLRGLVTVALFGFLPLRMMCF